MRSPSDRFFAVVVLGALLAVPVVFGTVRVTGTLILPEDDRITEDAYVFAERVVIEGVVEGDLVVVAGELIVDGHIEGDVLALVGGSIRISGVVDGSVRVASLSLDVDGSVADDVAAVAVEGRVGGPVGRDLLAVAGELVLRGAVGRDLRGQGFRMTIDGTVEGTVVVRADTVALGPGARVGGDVVFESGSEARVADGAEVSGELIHRRTLTPVWTRAVSRVLGVVSLLGFIVAGLVAQWLFRGTSRLAAETAASRPGTAALVGLAVLVAPPLLAVPLFLTLVGVPVALTLLLLWVVAVFLGPLPAVTVLGERLLRGRGGIAAGLVVGALALRLSMWLLPLIAAFLYLGFLLVGVGSYGMAAWSLRRQHAG